MIKGYAAKGADFSQHKIKISPSTSMTWKEAASAYRLARHYQLDDDIVRIPSSVISPAVMRGLTPLTLQEFRKEHSDELQFHMSKKITTGRILQPDLPEFDNLTESE